jgi:hypothetical protein
MEDSTSQTGASITDAEKIGRGIFQTVEKQAEEILDFLKEKGYTGGAIRFGSFSQDSEPPVRRRHCLMITIDATLSCPRN